MTASCADSKVLELRSVRREQQSESVEEHHGDESRPKSLGARRRHRKTCRGSGLRSRRSEPVTTSRDVKKTSCRQTRQTATPHQSET